MKKNSYPAGSIVSLGLALFLISCVPDQTQQAQENQKDGIGEGFTFKDQNTGATIRVSNNSEIRLKGEVNRQLLHRISSGLRECESSPSLPEGLELIESNGCLVRGTPLAPGESVHEISYQSSNGSQTKYYRIIITGKASPVISPSPAPTTPPMEQNSTNNLRTGIQSGAVSQAVEDENENENVEEDSPLNYHQEYLGKVLTYLNIAPLKKISTPNANCVAVPNLPTGLMLDGRTCTISGIPSIPLQKREQNIKLTMGGKIYTAKFFLEVASLPLSISYPEKSQGIVNTKINILPLEQESGSFAFKECSISPLLPAGLMFNSQTCKIEGVAKNLLNETEYKVTMSNTYGQQVTTSFNLEVVNPPSLDPVIPKDDEEFIIKNAPLKTCYYRIQVLNPGEKKPDSTGRPIIKTLDPMSTPHITEKELTCEVLFKDDLEDYPYLCKSSSIKVDLYGRNDVVCNFGIRINNTRTHVLLSDYKLTNNVINIVNKKNPLKIAIEECVSKNGACLTKSGVSILRPDPTSSSERIRSFIFKSSKNTFPGVMYFESHPGQPAGGIRGTVEYDKYYKEKMAGN